MRLTDWELDRLLIFTAAELARRHLSAGVKLNAACADAAPTSAPSTANAATL